MYLRSCANFASWSATREPGPSGFLGDHVGAIVRRPTGERDVLGVSIEAKESLDRRVAVAVTLLVSGAEPEGSSGGASAS